MDQQISLLALPREVIEIIFKTSCISVKDLANLKLACSSFNDIISSTPSLWKKKVHAHFSFLDPFYEKNNITDWYDQYKQIFESRKWIHKGVMNMSSKYRWRLLSIGKLDFGHIYNKSQENNGLAGQCFLYFSKEIIDAEVQCCASSNDLITLTNQHYARLVYDYVKQHVILKHYWLDKIKDAQTMTPDAVAKFVYSWLYPRFYPKIDVFDEFNDTLLELIISHVPDNHPLKQIDQNTKSRWKHSMLTENQFKGSDCRFILNIISKVLIKENTMDSFVSNLQCLQMGDLFRLPDCYKSVKFAVYEYAARCCGVRLVIRGSRDHQFLYWRENWANQSQKIFIDTRTGDLKMSTGRCPFAMNMSRPTEWDDVFNPLEFLLNLNLRIDETINDFNKPVNENAIELAFAVAPKNPYHTYVIASMYIEKKKYLQNLALHIQELIGSQEYVHQDLQILTIAYDSVVYANASFNDLEYVHVPTKRRSSQIMYSIGLVCQHLQYLYKCVITGWDYECKASLEWQDTMGVNRLPLGSKQPFYHVVAEDGSERYVAQENLHFLKSPRRLKNIEEKISIDFSHFDGTIYIPNKEKLMEYPDDPGHIIFFVNKMDHVSSRTSADH